MLSDFPWMGQPYHVAVLGSIIGNVGKGTAQMTQAKGLTHNVSMQGNTVDQRLCLRLLLHLVVLIDDAANKPVSCPPRGVGIVSG